MEKTGMEALFDELRAHVTALGYDCVGFEFVNENGMDVLRVYADMPGGVDLNDCETIARGLNEYLDSVESALPGGYFLEVSSPGLERPLFTSEDYARYVGREAALHLKNGKKRVGIIKSVSEDGAFVVLSCDGDEMRTALSDVRRGRLLYKEEKGQKKTFKKLPKKK